MPSKSMLAETEILVEEQLESPSALQESPLPPSPLPTQQDLNQLCRHLQSLRQQVERLEIWLDSSLRLLRATSAADDSATAIHASQVDELLAVPDRIEPTLNSPDNKTKPSKSSAAVSLPILADLIQKSHQKLNSRLKRVEEKLEALSSQNRAAREVLECELPVPDGSTVSRDGDLVEALQTSDVLPPEKPPTLIDLAALFGRDLIDDARTEAALAELTRQLADENPRAVGLLGQLMVWRSASRERIPKLLGEVGDAYYGCFPRTNDQFAEFEQALVEILVRKCIECEVPNAIELVQLGDRFDPSRHRLRAGERGVEVTEIHGWVVVGPDGQILNRAQVGVR